MPNEIVFCHNPKCRRNKLVGPLCSQGMNEIDYEKSWLKLQPAIDRETLCVETRWINRHLWKDPSKWAQDFYLCDDCHNAAVFIEGE